MGCLDNPWYGVDRLHEDGSVRSRGEVLFDVTMRFLSGTGEAPSAAALGGFAPSSQDLQPSILKVVDYICDFMKDEPATNHLRHAFLTKWEPMYRNHEVLRHLD